MAKNLPELKFRDKRTGVLVEVSDFPDQRELDPECDVSDIEAFAMSSDGKVFCLCAEGFYTDAPEWLEGVIVQ